MSQTTITLLFLAFAIVSFILEKIPLGLTASICALGLTLTGILDVSTTFSQYVNSNVILCVGMFVVGQALFETGMANKIGGLVTRFAKTEKTLIIAIMVIAGVMSGFLSNTGTAAVLIPVVCGIADESVIQKPPADAACICGSPRRKPLYHRSAGKFDGRQCTAGDGNQNQLFHVRANRNSDAADRNPLLRLFGI